VVKTAHDHSQRVIIALNRNIGSQVSDQIPKYRQIGADETVSVFLFNQWISGQLIEFREPLQLRYHGRLAIIRVSMPAARRQFTEVVSVCPFLCAVRFCGSV